MVDVVVIGAGPAGSMAAHVLAQRGCCAVLVEQQRFPRDKVCGECISALGAEVLERAGLMDAMRHAGAVRVARACMHAPDGNGVELELPRPIWGLSRKKIDVVLFEAARRSGAVIRQPVRCEFIVGGGERSVRLRELDGNRIEVLRAKWILVADGKSSLLPPRPRHTGDFGLKAHFADLDAPRDAVELFGLNLHYAGAAPIEGGLWNVAMSVPREQIAARGDLDGLFLEIVRGQKAMRRRFAHARRMGDWLATPLPRFGLRRNWPDGVIPIGNAAAAIEPIGGEGMGLAMRSGEMAAMAIADAVGRGEPVDGQRLRAGMARLWSGRGLVSRLAALFVSRPTMCSASVDLLRSSGSAVAMVMAWMGKGTGLHEGEELRGGI